MTLDKKNYDKRDIYEVEVKPLLEQLRGLCEIYELPLFALVGSYIEDKGESVKSEVAIVAGGNRVLMPDYMWNIITLMQQPADVYNTALEAVSLIVGQSE
jgi:hypothetical protein